MIWRKTAKSVPNWAFEVQIGGNLVEAMAKLKHAWDLYSSIPVLVTRAEQVPEADDLLGGSFHEMKEVARVLADDRLSEFYKVKLQFRELKNALCLV